MKIIFHFFIVYKIVLNSGIWNLLKCKIKLFCSEMITEIIFLKLIETYLDTAGNMSFTAFLESKLDLRVK